MPVRTLSFNFQNAPWTDVLKLFADAAGLTLNVRDVPPGDFTYYDDRRYSPTEALDLMNRYLLQQGHILVRHDRFLTVFDTEDGIPPNLIQTVSPEELSQRGGTELVRVSLPLGDREAAKAAEEVRALMGPQGSVFPLSSANSVVVTDIAENLIRVRELLAPPRAVEAAELTFRAFALRHVFAADAAETIRELLGQEQGVGNMNDSRQGDRDRGRGGNDRDDRDNRDSRGRTDPREAFRRAFGGSGDNARGLTPATAALANSGRAATVSVDARNNSVLVTATAADMKILDKIVEAIDIPADERGLAFQATRRPNQPYLVAYEVRNGDTGDIAQTLKVLHPGMVVNEDDDLDRIHVWATPDKHREIEAHVRQLDDVAAGDTLTLIPLNGIDAFGVTTTLSALWGDNDDAPAIQPDAGGRHLIVRGSAAQSMQIESLVRRMEANAGGAARNHGSRVVSGVDPAASPLVEQMLQDMFPQIVIEQADPAAAGQRRSVTPRRDRTTDSRENQSTRSRGDDDAARRAAFFERLRQQRGGGQRGGR
ncbi:MAG: secretin N-terminal domain-containing protein [Planctomycetaceae bacterium]